MFFAIARIGIKRHIVRFIDTSRAGLILALVFTAGFPTTSHAQVGAVDTAYNPNVSNGSIGGFVFATAVQPDGRAIIGGIFTAIGGVAVTNIARLNTDGSVDTTFTASTSDAVTSVAVQADGKILIGGSFAIVNGVMGVNRIARLNANGTLDSGFTVGGTGPNSSVSSVAVQSDGKILLGGFFTSFNGTSGINRITRLHANGMRDSGFNAGGTGADNFITSVTVQEDGKVLLGGGFTSFNGVSGINRIARLHADGALDADFNSGGAGADSSVFCVAVQADHKILLGGWFTSVNGVAGVNRITRLHADGTLDASFNGGGAGANSPVNSIAVQADGKILLGGAFSTVNGTGRGRIARLNPDGALDTSFSLNGPGANSSVYSVILQADGKILLSGVFTTFNGIGRNYIARLNNNPATQSLTAVDVTQVLWTRGGSAPDLSQVSLELSTDGGINYGPLVGTATRVGATANWQITGLSLPVNGHLRVRGRTKSGYQNSGSSLVETMTSFSGLVVANVTSVAPVTGTTAGGTSVTLTGTDFIGVTAVTFGGTNAASFSVDSPEQITATTPAHAPGAVSVLVATRGGTNAANTLFAFIPPPTINVSMANLSSVANTLTITGTNFSSIPEENAVIFTPVGSGTVTASTPTSLTVTGLTGLTPGALSAVVTTKGVSSGAAVQVATVVLPAPGTTEMAYNPNVIGPVGIGGVYGIAEQPGGGVVIGGEFSSIGGEMRTNLARLHANGNVDSTFTASANNRVYSVAVQSDGKILLGGFFTSVNGVEGISRIARLNADGTLDTSFNVGGAGADGGVYSVVLQADGKILLGGSFNSVNGVSGIYGIARLHADGTLDASFNVGGAGVVGLLYSVAVQEDGKILLGGFFTSVNGTARFRIARLHADGTLDSGFSAGTTWGGGSFRCVAVQADGRILIGGDFTSVNGVTGINRIARLHADGTLDNGFFGGVNFTVNSLALQADGKILLGGGFTSVNGVTGINRIARLHTNGMLDSSFNTSGGGVSGGAVNSVAVQGDGMILLGGPFTHVNGTARNRFARLHNAPATQSLTALDTTLMLWTRGGSAPELTQVSFELSADGGSNYMPLVGFATRVGTTANWKLAGLDLPANGHLRARGRAASGHQNGGSSVVEFVSSFSGLMPPILTVSNVDPDFGNTAGGTTVTITGTNFTGATAVTFDGTEAESFTVNSATQITATTPAHAAGPVSVVVTIPDGTNTFNSLYTYVAPPTVTFSSANLSSDPLSLTITGTGFSKNPEENVVVFTPAGSGIVTASTNTALTVTGITGLVLGALHAVLTTNGLSSGAAVQVANVITPAPASLHTTYNVNVSNPVLATVVRPGGGAIIGGLFTTVNDEAHPHIAQLNADGSLDATFNGSTDGTVNCVALQADGKVLIGGEFSSVNGVTGINRIARLHADGTLDSDFNSGGTGADGSVYSVMVQVDGKILLGGDFTSVNGVVGTKGIARLHANGTVDNDFNVGGAGTDSTVHSVLVQPDGKILLGGLFASVNDVLGINRIARLHADGQLDDTFNVGGAGANGGVNCVAVQPDGKILIGGAFTSVNDIEGINRIARLNADGTLDTGFNVGGAGTNNPVNSIVVQADGKILLGGAFTTVNGLVGKYRIVRLNVNGTHDSSFNIGGIGAYGIVRSVAVQADGMVLLGGLRSNPSDTTRDRFTRLHNDPATQSLAALNTTEVLWTRGGSAPEVSQVTLELSTDDGSNYAPLAGTVARLGGTANWQIIGLSLPTNGHLRVRGRTTSGSYNGGSGLMESVISFTGLAPPPPTVTQVTPSLGTVAGGTQVTIIGSNFTGVSAVTFGGGNAASFTVDSPTQISATTPAHAVGVASVQVTNPGGTNADNTLYTYIAPKIVVTGNNVSLVDGDSMPSLTNHTDFGSVTRLGSSVVRTFTIANIGTADLVLGAVTLNGPGAGDFTVTMAPTTSVVPTGATSFQVTFNPSANGLRSATLSFSNNDPAENPFTFSIQGTGVSASMNVVGNGEVIVNGDTAPDETDGSDFGSVSLLNTQATRVFTISNSGNVALNLTGTPPVEIMGAHANDFTVTTLPAPSVAVGESTSFAMTFDPELPGLRTAVVSIANDDPERDPFTFGVGGFGGLSKMLEQSIAFTAPSTVYLGEGPMTLVAETSSGLPVTLELVAGPGTLVESILTPTGTGKVIVRATQAGGENYAAAKAVTRVITVKGDPSVLTLTGLSQRYDGAPKAIGTVGAAGLVEISYRVGGVFDAAPPTAAGRYAVQAVANGVTKVGTLVIAKAPLYVVPEDKRKFAGEANPGLSLTYEGFIGGDTEAEVTSVPVLRTTAKTNSVGGVYPITASDGAAANYALIYRQGTLVVESFAAGYEALLVDVLDVPSGKLSLTVAKSGRSFSGSLALAGETKALRVSGPLVLDPGTESATGEASVVRDGVTYALNFNLTIDGLLTGTVMRAGLNLATAEGGRRLLALPRGEMVTYSGAHTAVLEPAQPEGVDVPAGAGWARATINTRGAIALVGRIGDGTAFTTSLLPDSEPKPGYRLWVQPYKPARGESFLSGEFAVSVHPLLNRGFVAAEAELSWVKAERAADKSYPLGFVPLAVGLKLDPWIKPTAAAPLATLLGLRGDSFSVEHSATGSASNGDLPATLTLSTRNVVSVLGGSNSTKWNTKLNPTNGTFTGSFELLDAGVRRVVPFSGVLRQPAEASDEVIGDGHFLLPEAGEVLSGEVLFLR